MPSSLETLYSVISPSELAVALGYKLTQFDETTFFYDDPRQGKVWVMPRGFLVDDLRSEMKAWSIVDFMARELATVKACVTNDEAYLVAMQELFRIFADKLPKDAPDQERNIVELAAEARIRRKIFTTFFYKDPAASPTMQEALLLSNLASSQRSIDSHPTVVLVLNEEKLQTLQTLLRQLNKGQEIILPAEPCYAIPYLSDFATVNGFEIAKDLRPAPGYRYFAIDSKTFGYNGLLSWRPGHKTFLATDPFRGLAVNSQFTEHHLPGSCLTPMANLVGSVFTWKPKSIVFAKPQDDSHVYLQTPAMLCKAGVEVSVTDVIEPLAMFAKPTIPWIEYILTRIVTQIEKDGDFISPMTRLFITSCPARPEVKQRLANMLREQRQHRACLDLETILYDGLFSETSKGFIFESAKGYLLEEKSRRGVQTPLTNFVLELKSRVVFPGVSQSSYEADIIMGGRRTTRLLSDDEINDVAKLDRTLRSRPPQAGDPVTDLTPTIYDRHQARALIHGWKMIMAKLPVVTGISYLGWNMDRSVFYGPSFTVSSSGFDSETKVLQEGILALQHYSNAAWEIGALDTNLPEPLANIISQAVAMVARQYMGFPIQPVKIRNGPAAQRTLQLLFEGLGQTSAVFFNGNVRPITELNGNAGYPGWSLGYTSSQTTRSKLPFFMLMDCGLNLQHCFSEEVMASAVATFRTVFIAVIQKMIRTRGALFERSNSILYDNSLVREGRRLICESTDLEAWPSMPTPYETIEKLLRSIPLGDTNRYFTQSLRQQLIWINLDHLPEKVSKTDLFMELTPLVKHIRDLGSAIEIDAMSGTEMLNTFYNERAFTTPVDTDELLAQVPGNTAR